MKNLNFCQAERHANTLQRKLLSEFQIESSVIFFTSGDVSIAFDNIIDLSTIAKALRPLWTLHWMSYGSPTIAHWRFQEKPRGVTQ